MAAAHVRAVVAVVLLVLLHAQELLGGQELAGPGQGPAGVHRDLLHRRLRRRTVRQRLPRRPHRPAPTGRGRHDDDRRAVGAVRRRLDHADLRPRLRRQRPGPGIGLAGQQPGHGVVVLDPRARRDHGLLGHLLPGRRPGGDGVRHLHDESLGLAQRAVRPRGVGGAGRRRLPVVDRRQAVRRRLSRSRRRARHLARGAAGAAAQSVAVGAAQPDDLVPRRQLLLHEDDALLAHLLAALLPGKGAALRQGHRRLRVDLVRGRRCHRSDRRRVPRRPRVRPAAHRGGRGHERRPGRRAVAALGPG